MRTLPLFLFLFAGLALVLTGCLSSDSSEIEIGPNKASALGTPTIAGQAQVLSDETLEPEAAPAAVGISEEAVDGTSLDAVDAGVSDEALAGGSLDESAVDLGLSSDVVDGGLEADPLDADSSLVDSALDEPVLEEEPA